MARTLAIIGAGPGLGLGVARAFGRRGFQVALIARTPATLEAMSAELAELGITAAGFAADIRDRDSLIDALAAAKARFGPIDVLEYSPSPTGTIAGASAVTVEDVAAQLDLHVLGAVAAVGQVLPDMLARGEGALLLTTGVSSTVPAPFLANVGMAMAALRNWAHTLHAELAPRGVYAATVTIASGIIPGDSVADPDVIGARYYDLYDLYERRDRAELVIGDLEAFRTLVAQVGANTT